MSLILSYAVPERRPAWRRWVGVVAAWTSVALAALILAATFQMRMQLASYVGGGWCGTARASLEANLYLTPLVLSVPCFGAASIAEGLHQSNAVERIAMAVLVPAWAAIVFVG